MIRYRTVWHPESPGGRVIICHRWWNRHRKFATLTETIKYFAMVQEQRRFTSIKL